MLGRVASTGLALAAGAMSPAAAAPSEAQVQKVEHALYDLCPRLLRGELAADLPQAMEAVGYRPIAPLGRISRWRRGEGDDTIVFGGNARLCIVAFDGGENAALFDHASSTSVRHGFVEQPLTERSLRSDVRNYRREVAGSNPWLLTFLGETNMADIDVRPLTFATMIISER